KGVSPKELGEYPAFAAENLKGALPGKYMKFGDNIYLVPEELPSLKGLKVLRPGLQLGTCKKNRFEPSHGLALALSPNEVKHVWDLSSTDSTCRAYLNGQTFPCVGEKGWYLICVDGFSMGWGKLAGGMMKNHYPKGLRIQC
ncbi:MAG: RsmF rRNA methyltransferase first C-terminal domain-containing protein, partial [Lachnospiraceae bacterium]|nr:RsmF rRNA methyltransferase first C-terminal domain-containing protein [Lachnospiraceae bacterium]